MLLPDLVQFVKNTEKMVSPKTVGGLYSRAEMLSRLPIKMQKFIVEKAPADPFIGFIVEPYSFFLAYEIIDPTAAQKYLPPDYELVPCSMFDDGEPKFCGIIGAFNVHTSVFWGSRIELYVIAENKKTGLMSWIICDYESDTINYDPGQGFSGSTTKHCVITTAHTGDVIVDIASAESSNQISLKASIKQRDLRNLDQRLWVEGNLSVDYGGHLEDGSVPFGLIFDSKEMVNAMDIPPEEVNIDMNTFGQDMFADRPFEACCFPFAQHFLTTSYPIVSEIKNAQDLETAIHAFNKKVE